ncbi:MAG: isoaspartyl peptidase/L-asparaginase [Actinobacteria bacterium]|nr:isoaspartyl peptidase/L-asparaginase [Actinomycetota bacterium]
MAEAALAVHGGAGPAQRGADEKRVAALERALSAGWAALDSAGALEAVQAAVETLEDAPEFNAGRGSVLTADGRVEMDAAIASGTDGRAGAVACVSRVRHPVALARVVMEATPHVLLAGPAAERFAEERDLELMTPSWFVTPRQRERHDRRVADAIAAARQAGGGTVGAVARDRTGALAAATSTGGAPGQLPGRIGDSPLIGAGTYADTRCAVSATGDGEAVIRAVAAHEVAALVRHTGIEVAEACERVLHERVEPLGHGAGMIALGPEGAPAMPFTTEAMHRAWRVGERTGVASATAPERAGPA